MNVYFIAGPPGIGKSTYGRELVPAQIPIIDHDLAAYQYKKKGFSDYSELASLKANQFVKDSLLNNENLSQELNLGYESHYQYLKSIASSKHVKIHLVLFFTDDVNLCIFRAEGRYKNGGHQVTAEVITEMYKNTLPLLKQHIILFSTISFISVSNSEMSKVNSLNIPNWMKDSIFIQYVVKAN